MRAAAQSGSATFADVGRYYRPSSRDHPLNSKSVSWVQQIRNKHWPTYLVSPCLTIVACAPVLAHLSTYALQFGIGPVLSNRHASTPANQIWASSTAK